jgi:hypothetical protein
MREMPPHIIPLNDCLGTLWAAHVSFHSRMLTGTLTSSDLVLQLVLPSFPSS